MTEKRQPELLSPAGDMEGVRAAIRYGADAVYIGGRMLQMRAQAAGFSDAGLAEASRMLHSAGRRLYVTVNSLAFCGEIDELGDYARLLSDIGADGVIVSDLGVLAEMKSKAPNLEAHISTQASCMNHRAARVYRDMGADRIVLARELSIEQIAELTARGPAGMTYEAFVHGAMCMAYSGRCLISAFLTGRSGSRGECAQSCRWSYRLEEQKRPGEYFAVEGTEQGSAILSSKDMCAVELLGALAEAGVTSYKIEGRMKTPYYIATVTNAYRCAMDGSLTPAEAMAELCSVSHRPYCTGFYLGPIDSHRENDSGEYIRECTFVGTALRDSSDGRLDILTRNYFREGDTLEALSPGMAGRAFIACGITNSDGEAVEASNHPMAEVTVDCPAEVSAGDIIRLRAQA